MDDLHTSVYLPDLLVTTLSRDLGRPAIYLDDEILTAGQLGQQVSRYAQAYAALGLRPGSGVAMLSTNRPEVLYATGASMVSGCRGTPLHPLGSLEDHAYVLGDAGIEALVFDPSFAGRAAALRDRVPSLTRLLSFGPGDVGDDLTALAAGYRPGPLAAPSVDPEAISSLAYTGGTTGEPKGVMSTYRGGAAMLQIMLTEWQWPTDLRHLVCTPLSHAGAAFVVPALIRGGSIVVLPRFDAGQVLGAIERHRITSLFLVPSMIYALLDHPAFPATDLSSLQTVFYGASPIAPARLRAAIRAMGPVFFQFYGQTEAPQTVWNKPEQTAEVFRHGWLHTGDIAREDQDGFFTIVDRKKDMIVSGGFNVFPREIEDVLATHPAVSASAVIGVPDPTWGEAVKAVIALRPGSPATAAELTALVRERKGPHHAPKSVDFVDAIPLTPVGKPDKKALRARYWADADRQVG